MKMQFAIDGERREAWRGAVRAREPSHCWERVGRMELGEADLLRLG